MLADLAHSNMFLVALDARGEWYRYHHLFGEVLQLELGTEAAGELRRRAAAWCSAHGLVEEAIEYAAAAGDAEMVAGLLIERHLDFIWGGGWGSSSAGCAGFPPSCSCSIPSYRHRRRRRRRCSRHLRSTFGDFWRWPSALIRSGRTSGRRT